MALLYKFTIKKGQIMELASDNIPTYATNGYVILKDDMMVENCYHKVLNINTNDNDGDFICSFNLGIFENKESKKPIHVENYTCSINKLGYNYIKQVYEYLKTLEEFKDAEDC